MYHLKTTFSLNILCKKNNFLAFRAHLKRMNSRQRFSLIIRFCDIKIGGKCDFKSNVFLQSQNLNQKFNLSDFEKTFWVVRFWNDLSKTCWILNEKILVSSGFD